MSKELRYLLHGNKTEYENVQTPLYVTSQESTVWQKIGQQVLHRQGEAWRLIDPALVEHIPREKRQKLGINLLQSDEVVNLIGELGAECVDGMLLDTPERYELLRYISQKPKNEALWRSLQLHETKEGRLERIDLGRVYLDNPDFPLDERLRERIVLIRLNEEIQQNWIPQWTPNEAIATVLKFPNPHDQHDLILNALQQMSSQEKEELKNNLQNFQNATWLPSKLDKKGIRPLDVIKLPTNLAQHAQALASLDSTKYPESILPESVRKSDTYKWLRTNLFTSWNVETAIVKVLKFPNKAADYWRYFCPVILDALHNFEIPKQLETSLKTENWLFLENRAIIPTQVIEIVPNTLKKHLTTLVDLSSEEYTEASRLPQAIREHGSFKAISEFFSRWRENDIIDFILKQRDTHKHYEVVLDALSSLLGSQQQRSPNETNFQKLKTTAWLADEQGNAVLPQNVLHYLGLEEEIEGLLLSVSCSYIASSQLAKQIRVRSDCWQWLVEKLFIIQDRTLTELGLLLKLAPDYQLGEFALGEFPLERCLEVFGKMNVNFLPAWNLAQKISKEQFKQSLLKNLLGRMDVDLLCKLLQHLSNTTSQSHTTSQPEEATVEVFNAYLRLSTQYNELRHDILPKIRLINRRGEWQTPDKLTWGKRDNIEGAYVLDEKQAEILHSYLSTLPTTNSTVNQLAETALDETNFNVLQAYFRPWNQYCTLEPIGAFLSLLHGGDGKVKQLAHVYLGKRDLGILRQRLVENQSIASRSFHIYVGKAGDRTREVRSVLGGTFKAELANTQNPSNLFVSRLTPKAKELELLPIQTENFTPTQLAELLEASTRMLLNEVYRVKAISLNAIWKDLLQSDQLDIQVAKTYLLEGVSHTLPRLGVQNKSPLLKKILDELEKLRFQKVELEAQRHSSEKIDSKIKELNSQLSKLFESEASESKQVRTHLLEAVRAEIKQHGYRQQSIPFELFQNADDAVIEWMKMSPLQQLEDVRKQFVVVWSERKLLFIHAGRPIGCFQHPDRPQEQHRDKGYDRDLVKMLTFNISDKGKGETGKFGLGFKSVYLASKRPCVLSKSLGFAVEGGLIPSRLTPENANNLRGELQRYGMPSDATIVELPLDDGISPQEVKGEFRELANILIVFSRAITTCRFFGDREETLTWRSSPLLGIQGVEANKFERNGKSSIMLCLRTQKEAEAALLIGFAEQNGRLASTIGDRTPTFWVTAPTQERLYLGFALNANFEITPGRESLMKASAGNRELATRIGVAFGEVLYRLFRASTENWQAMTEVLGITTADEYEFWNFLWKELAVRWQKRDPSEGRDIINQVLGGDRSMGYLISRCKSLPSGLHGSYRQLISLNDVRYKVTGFLAEPDCFLQVASWSGFEQNYRGKLIARTQWEDVKRLLGATFNEQRYTVSDLRLLDALRQEIGTTEPRVAPSQARQVGNLISKDFLNSSSFSTSPERNELQRFLQEVQFMSKADTYLPCQQLLANSPSQPEEVLLVGFAPDSRILHPDYRDSASAFFLACRHQRENISIEELVTWALQAETTEKRNAVYQYLFEGERRDKLAPVLYANREGSWIANNPDIIDTLELMVLIGTKRAEVSGSPDPLENAEIIELPGIDETEEDFEDYNPNLEFRTSCVRNDFDEKRSPDEFEAFAQMLLKGLDRQYSSWKGYIYHFTHVENAVSILASDRLLARNLCRNFSDSAGAHLIARTGNDVKNFARFYLRPQTPTQWHNESLGKRRGDIYALCPVPIFFRFNLRRVLETHRSKCGISSGNLAASGSHYGNSSTFLEQCFDFNNVYSTLQQVGKETFLRASQQEFIVQQYLDIAKLSLEDITIICRTSQDKATLLHLLGRDSKYASRVFEEQEIVNSGSLFHHQNPSVKIKNDGQSIEVQIDKYDRYADVIHGELILSFAQQSPLEREIHSQFKDISRISLGQSIRVSASRCIQLQSKPNTRISVYFQEDEKNWLIYTDEPQNT